MPRAKLEEIFHSGQSPYFGMFRAGRLGYSIEETISVCTALGLPVRNKDIEAWQDGAFKNQLAKQVYHGSTLNPGRKPSVRNVQHIFAVANNKQVVFNKLPKLPQGWQGTQRRFFPCSSDNRPLISWGWKFSDDGIDYTPELMLKADAKALSPVGWVGQNMLYQPFIVLDIDGVGHGCMDEQVIAFGSQFKNDTLCLEDPNKPGSFHLYFTADRLIPVKHFPHAKLDMMGNAVNAAVYFKNKISNNVPAIPFTEEIWNMTMNYQEQRRANA